MTTAHEEPSGWYSVPELADLFGVRLRDVRTMLRERRLLAVPHGPNAAASVPAEMVLGPEEAEGPCPLPSLRGTLILLGDAGLGDDEAMRWLYTANDELGSTPMTALRERRTHAVRRVAQTLAF
ncbi:Rv2175c family DNA-binding protein [Georgenia sp. AZ-5]|uniref:Rv2175c family DNA-binding protein n=1 Tax=Georgenia sp. AZ-5 TaxID=3367526 RepID=UPI003754B7CC